MLPCPPPPPRARPRHTPPFLRDPMKKHRPGVCSAKRNRAGAPRRVLQPCCGRRPRQVLDPPPRDRLGNLLEARVQPRTLPPCRDETLVACLRCPPPGLPSSSPPAPSASRRPRPFRVLTRAWRRQPSTLFDVVPLETKEGAWKARKGRALVALVATWAKGEARSASTAQDEERRRIRRVSF